MFLQVGEVKMGSRGPLGRVLEAKMGPSGGGKSSGHDGVDIDLWKLITSAQEAGLEAGPEIDVEEHGERIPRRHACSARARRPCACFA